jgi:MFS family permease
MRIAAGEHLSEWREGWGVVLASAICMVIPALNGYTIGVLSPAIAAEFGWSSAQVMAPYTISAVLSGLAAPFAGKAVDRFGARKVGLAGIALFMLAYLGIGLLSSASFPAYLAVWFGASLLLAPAGVITWTLGVASQFTTQRGLALAAALCGTSLMGAIAAPVASALLQSAGWRAAYVTMALGFGLLTFAAAFMLFRVNSGAASTMGPSDGPPTSSPVPVPGLSFRQALRTREYWMLAVMLLLTGGGMAGMLLHLSPIMLEMGLAPISAAFMVSVAALTAVPSRLLCGLLLDHVFAPLIGIVIFLSATAAVAVLLFAPPGISSGIFAAILFGVMIGAEIDLIAYASSRYFGLRQFGVIYGTLYAAFTIGQGIAPPLVGHIHDTSGSYGPALMLLGGCFLCGALIMPFMGRYRDFTRDG